MPILLQKLLLSLRLLRPRLLRPLQILLQPLLLRQRSPSLDLLSLELALQLDLLVPFYACEFAQSPGFELAFGVEAVGVVYVGDFCFFLLCWCRCDVRA